jgi:hypothetical protein
MAFSVIIRPLAACLLLLAGVAIGTGTMAQTPPATPPATPPVLAPAPPAISDSHLAAARDVLTASGIARSFEGIVPQIAEQIRQNISRQRPELIRDMEEALRAIIPELQKQLEPIVLAAARAYAMRMSETELKDTAVFFKSASGQKYVAAQAPIMNDVFAEMQVFSNTLGNVMIDRLREEMRKKGHQL